MRGEPRGASREGRIGPVRPELPTRRTSERILRTTTHPASHPAHSDNRTGSILFQGASRCFLPCGPFQRRKEGSRRQEAGSRRQEAGSRKQEAGGRKRRTTTNTARENRPADRNDRRLPQPAAASLRNRHPALAPHRRPAGSGRSATARKRPGKTRRARQNAPPRKAG